MATQPTFWDKWPNVSKMLQVASVHRVPETITVVIAIVSIGLGATIGLSSEAFLKAPTFRAVFAFASPNAWSVTYCILGVACIVTLLADRRSTRWPALALCFTYVLFGVLTLFSVPQGGVPSAIWAYAGLGMVCAVIVMAYAYDEDEEAGK